LAANKQSDIHLIKAAQVWPFLDTVSRRGGSVVSLCRKAGLPLDAVRRKKGVVGERAAWRFIEEASEQLCLEHLGYLCAVEHPVDSARELGGLRMRMAPTLQKMLEFFIEDVRTENTGVPYSLRPDGALTWFHRDIIFRHSAASWQTEQYMIMVIIQIVRICAGDAWLPSRLRIASSKNRRSVPKEWSNIDIEWGQEATEIAIEGHVMALPSREAEKELARRHDRDPDDDIAVPDIAYLVDRQIWSGRTSIDDAAFELGLSVTTLKRRLRESGQSYSDVVKIRRQTWAEKLLKNTDTPIQDIARTLGYKHASNFTRAFERMTGISPRAFRRVSREN
jgi:AraC-like DNA-binding protein